MPRAPAKAKSERKTPVARKKAAPKKASPPKRKPLSKVRRSRALTPAPVSLSRRAKLKPARAVSADERARAVKAVREIALECARTCGGRVPSSEQLVRWFAEVEHIEIAPRTARRWMASRKSIVAKARQSVKSMMAERQRQWLRWCAENGIAPGHLAGVDGRDWL